MRARKEPMVIVPSDRSRPRRRLQRAVAAAALLLPTPGLAHADLSWAASYRSADNVPCCTGDNGAGHGDCARLPAELAGPLGIGSAIAVTYPSGVRLTTVNAIFPTPDEHGAYVICAPGCLFKPAGV
jgi:hypothetical protein